MNNGRHLRTLFSSPSRVSLFPALVGGAVLLELVLEQLGRALANPLVELSHALVLALPLHRRPLQRSQ